MLPFTLSLPCMKACCPSSFPVINPTKSSTFITSVQSGCDVAPDLTAPGRFFKSTVHAPPPLSRYVELE